MLELIETIRSALGEGATIEQKAAGAKACRILAAALEAVPGRPIVLPGAPAAGSLASFDMTQALDLIIARLRAVVPPDEAETATWPGASGLRLALAQLPARAPRGNR